MGTSDVSVTADQFVEFQLNFTGSPGGQRTVTLPAVNTGLRGIYNGTDKDLAFKVAGGSQTVLVSPNTRTLVGSTGKEIFKAT
ncbi:hypothetical protein LVJ94_27000 [Pendulispora rubella]|uniref:Uncharacterized protein n=1 Tax=Pendulispora rubella TaxID=2741070 RepID=A0ABZ2KPH5_9BACT